MCVHIIKNDNVTWMTSELTPCWNYSRRQPRMDCLACLVAVFSPTIANYEVMIEDVQIRSTLLRINQCRFVQQLQHRDIPDWGRQHKWAHQGTSMLQFIREFAVLANLCSMREMVFCRYNYSGAISAEP